MNTLRGRLLFVIALTSLAIGAMTIDSALAQTSVNFCAKKKKPD